MYDEGHQICFFTSRLKNIKVQRGWQDTVSAIVYLANLGWKLPLIDNHIVRATRFNSKMTEFIKKMAEVEVFDD